MKKIYIEKKDGIDWGKPQWVISGELVVLTTGSYNEHNFEGTCLPCEDYPCGRYGGWNKEIFKPLTFNITFIISNED